MTDETTTEAAPETEPKPEPKPDVKAEPKPEKAAKPEAVDPNEWLRAVQLRFVKGTGVVMLSIPARNLTGSDLARRVYIETRLKRDAAGFKRAYDALIERLVSTGMYEREN